MYGKDDCVPEEQPVIASINAATLKTESIFMSLLGGGPRCREPPPLKLKF
jgi:hypothetical protein